MPPCAASMKPNRTSIQAISLAPQIIPMRISSRPTSSSRETATSIEPGRSCSRCYAWQASPKRRKMQTGQGFEYSSDLRVFPDTYTEIFDAFESERIERFRGTQPAVIATIHLARALIIEAAEGPPVGDRPLRLGEGLLRARYPVEPAIGLCLRVYNGGLGLAYAGLGREKEAIAKEKKPFG